MPANHTPLVMMAGQGLMEDTALDVNADMQSQITTYLTKNIVSNFKSTVSSLKADEYDATTNPDGIPTSTINNVIHSLDSTAPVLVDVIPTSAGVGTDYFTTFLNQHIDNLFPGDNGLYAQRLQTASGFAEQMNQFVNTAVNGQSLGVATFQSMDALTTGNIALVNSDTQTFGEELQASGDLYNFANVDIISTPHGLAECLSRINSLATIADQLEAQGLDAFDLQDAIESNPNLEMKPLAQKRLYNAFLNVTDAQLNDILLVMEFETTGIETLADLLDIRKVFPNSYDTMQTVIDGTSENIFVGEKISEAVSGLSSSLEQAFPVAQAKAAKAFSISLQQIKGIHDSNPRDLGAQAASIEKNDGLDDITVLPSPMPADTVTHYQNEVGGGSGPDGTYFVSDLVGTPAGIPHTENLTTINTNIDALSTAGALTNIEQILQVMADVVAGVYNDGLPPPDEESLTLPVGPGGPATYANKTTALAVLQTDLDNAVADLGTNYPTELTAMNDAFQNSIDHILRELKSLGEAMVYFNTTYTVYDALTATSFDAPPSIAPGKQTILSFASSLPTLGLKTDKGNVAEILEKLATDTRGGQAVIGAMREGRNSKKFSDAGIQADNKIDDSPKTVIPGDIS